MRRVILVWVAGVLLVAGAGCSSHQALSTRTYKLPLGDSSWDAITMVLNEEWERHSVTSHAERHGDGAAVQTTARGHRQIEAALARR